MKPGESVFWKPGQSGNPAGRPKGAKNKDTIAKEERRAIFDEEVSKMFLEKIKEARPEYLLDQFLGKAGDKLDITSGDKPIQHTQEELEALAKKMAEELKNNA